MILGDLKEYILDDVNIASRFSRWGFGLGNSAALFAGGVVPDSVKCMYGHIELLGGGHDSTRGSVISDIEVRVSVMYDRQISDYPARELTERIRKRLHHCSDLVLTNYGVCNVQAGPISPTSDGGLNGYATNVTLTVKEL